MSEGLMDLLQWNNCQVKTSTFQHYIKSSTILDKLTYTKNNKLKVVFTLLSLRHN